MSFTNVPRGRIETVPAYASPGSRESLDAESLTERPVFNRTVALRDTWAKIQKRGG